MVSVVVALAPVESVTSTVNTAVPDPVAGTVRRARLAPVPVNSVNSAGPDVLVHS